MNRAQLDPAWPRLDRILAGLALAALLFGGAILALGFTNRDIDLPGVQLSCVVAVGWSFVGVGLYAWRRRPDNRFGALMVAAGFAWFVGAMTLSDIPLVFTLGAWLGALYLAVIVHLLLAFPTGRLETRTNRELVVGAYVVTTVLVLPALAFVDFEQTGCDDCPRNVFLISASERTFDVLDVITSLLGLLLAIGVGQALWERWRDASPRQRRALAPVLAAGGLATVALGFSLALDVLGTAAGPVEVAALVGVAAVPWCFLIGLARSAVARGGAMGELVTRLGGAELGPGDVRAALADALGDDHVQLAYWIPESSSYVDLTGHELGTVAQGRALTPVELEGRRVGAIVHEADLLDSPGHVRAVADAAALALERERLEAELRAKVEELRASRARIVEAGYAAGRRLERDLHDGAQQRLVSLALELRMAEERIAADPAEGRRLVATARKELGAAIDELRDFARGLHPGILADRGLDAALSALASRAPLPVEVEGSSDGRLAPGVESAAYFVVAEALTNVARYAEAESATISIARANGALVVEVRDDGVGGADPTAGSGLRGLSDRVAALDGRLEVESERGAGTVVRARIPCTETGRGLTPPDPR